MSTPSDRELDALASGELDDQDAQLLHRTAALHETLDPVPRGLVDRIRFAITGDLVRVAVADPSTVDAERLDALVAANKPAHLPHAVEVVRDGRTR